MEMNKRVTSKLKVTFNGGADMTIINCIWLNGIKTLIQSRLFERNNLFVKLIYGNNSD